MIISSLLSQYGIRVYSSEFQSMQWKEFIALLSGLGPDTPLGRIVQIRSEEDKDILKGFTRGQHRIRNAWRSRKAKKIQPEDMNQFLESMKQVFIKMAGGVNN